MTRNSIQWDIAAGWFGVLIFTLAVWVAIFTTFYLATEPGDYTDTGVGCIDDCLDQKED